MFDIVLVAPQIPQNTGTIGRLCVCTDSRLHLIKPLGFEIDESRIRRAGMDYWQFLDVQVYEDWEEFIRLQNPQRMVFASTKTEQSIYSWDFTKGDFIVFGNEGSGLPPALYETYADSLRTIPMPGSHSRSHNLANSVSIVLYEALRQVNAWD